MTAKLIVTFLGLTLIVLVNWYFFFSKRKIFKISPRKINLQEVKVVVKGGYIP